MIAGLLVAVMVTSPVADAPAWLAGVGDRTAITSVHAEAHVTVSDGLTYSTVTEYEGPDRASFRRIYAERTITHGIDGSRVWQDDGGGESEADVFFAMFVMGHQIHAQILFFDRIHPGLQPARPAEFMGLECLVVSDGGEHTWRLYYSVAGRPLGMELPLEGADPILYRFEAWREVAGIELPFLVRIDDGERQFEYRFTSLEMGAK